MQNVPIFDLAISAACLLAYVKFAPLLRQAATRLRPFPESPEDKITWTTRGGTVYEDVGTFFIRADAVTFRHKYGTARVAISDLTDSSRVQLIRRYQENYSLTVLSRDQDMREVQPFEIEAA